MIDALAALFFSNHSQCNWTVSCNRSDEAANHTKSTQLNPLFTELITITIATTI